MTTAVPTLPYDEIQSLALRVNTLEKRTRRVERASQAAFRGVDLQYGSINFYSEDEVVASLGDSGDGTPVLTYNEALAPTPPVPSSPDVVGVIDGVQVTYDGTFEDDFADWTPSIARVEVHALDDPGDECTDLTQVHEFSSTSGGVYTWPAAGSIDPKYFKLVAVSVAEIESLPSSSDFGTPILAADSADLIELITVTLPGLQTDLAAAEITLNTLNTVTLPALTADLLAAQIDITNLGSDVVTLQTDLATAQGDITGLGSDITTLQGDLITAQSDISTAQADISTLDGKFPIGSTDIQDDAITTPKMTANSINGDRILANTLNASKIVAGSITTTEMTANTINGDRILVNTLNAAKIVAGSITTAEMTANTINGDRILVNTLNASKIVAGSITSNEMTANSINGDRISAGTLDAAKIVAGSITTTQMTANSINGDRITANTLDAAKIVAGSITTAKLSATAIDGMTITGALFRTAAGSQRIEITSATVNVVRMYSGDVHEQSYGALQIGATVLGGGARRLHSSLYSPFITDTVTAQNLAASIVVDARVPNGGGAVTRFIEVTGNKTFFINDKTPFGHDVDISGDLEVDGFTALTTTRLGPNGSSIFQERFGTVVQNTATVGGTAGRIQFNHGGGSTPAQFTAQSSNITHEAVPIFADATIIIFQMVNRATGAVSANGVSIGLFWQARW